MKTFLAPGPPTETPAAAATTAVAAAEVSISIDTARCSHCRVSSSRYPWRWGLRRQRRLSYASESRAGNCGRDASQGKSAVLQPGAICKRGRFPTPEALSIYSPDSCRGNY